jgi:signal transduction histidine kinase
MVMETERLSEQDRLKSELVATVSHEMRRPLTAVLGFAQTLRMRWDSLTPELREELLDRLERNAEALEHMIGQALDYSRLQLGQFPMELRPIDLEPLIVRVVENLAYEVAGHDVRVSVGAGLRVSTEPYAFERILGNLLSNSAKFSPPSGAIEVTAARDGEWIEISVEDQGEGVPKSARERVFDHFYRGSTSVPGSGLGLAVVRELANLHGGSVRIEDPPQGRGAVFTVRLPAAD